MVNVASEDWHRCDVDDVAARVVEVKQALVAVLTKKEVPRRVPYVISQS